MPSYVSAQVSDYVAGFAVDLASAVRIFTARQLAQHPELSGRSQPERIARVVLNQHPAVFEQAGGPMHEPIRWRLTRAERSRRGIKHRPISGISQRSHHWLELGDIWLALTFAGGRPTEWVTERDGQFDVMFIWQRRPYLLEHQRTPITEKQWVRKWELRRKWYREQQWDVKPIVILVNTTGQQDSTIHLPKGTIHARSIDELPRMLMRPPR